MGWTTASLKGDSPAVVNTASIVGLRPGPQPLPYAASKAAVVNLTKTLAWNLGPEIRVNAVAPGPIETAMLDRLTLNPERKAALLAGVPLKRAGTPEEIADAIRFVGSRQAGFMTGEVLRVNGGRTAA